MQQQPGNQPQQQYPYPQFQTPSQPPISSYPPPVMPPQPPKKRRRWVRWTLIIIAALLVISVINAIVSGGNGVGNTPTGASSQSTQASHPTTALTQVSKPTAPTVHYPPKTEADLRALAAKGDASAIHEFHSESVGMTGACPQPKREVTVDPSITGQQFAEDLLAYFYYANHLDSPCGSIVFAYHSQAEAQSDNGYTAGRIMLDVSASNGQPNFDPNGTGLKYSLTLDTGGNLDPSAQEYMVNY